MVGGDVLVVMGAVDYSHYINTKILTIKAEQEQSQNCVVRHKAVMIKVQQEQKMQQHLLPPAELILEILPFDVVKR